MVRIFDDLGQENFVDLSTAMIFIDAETTGARNMFITTARSPVRLYERRVSERTQWLRDMRNQQRPCNVAQVTIGENCFLRNSRQYLGERTQNLRIPEELKVSEPSLTVTS